MTVFEKPAPKPRRGVGSAAATRKWRLTKEITEMREKRLERERKGALDYINRRKSEHTVVLTGEEWGRMVAFQACDAVVAVSRVADHLPDVSLNLSFKDALQAYTDFKNVTVALNPKMVPSRDDTPELLAEKIATIKGISYHEIGHIRFSVRPWDLFTDEDARWKYFRTWNILEDQRMESWGASLNPRLANLFTIMISQVILQGQDAPMFSASDDAPKLNHWILLAGRDYLPMEVLEASYFSSPWEPELCEEWFQIVHRYKKATTIPAMRQAVKDAYEFLHENQENSITPGGVDEHETDGGGMQGPAGPGPSPDLGQGDGDGDGDGDGGKQGVAKDGKGKSPMAGKDAPQGHTDQSLIDAVVNAKRESVEEFAKRGDVQSAVSRVNDIASSSHLPAPSDNMFNPMTSEVLTHSEAMAEGMKRALSSFMTATDPYWVNHQETGVLDALAYRTKEPGTRDYRRHRIDFDGKGRNVHVSLLCDISGSMHGEPMLALSMALYATAQACDDLDIGRTLILWSTVYHEIWAHGPAEAVVWDSCGGTQPIPALDTLDDHNVEEAANHLVLVFTDGAWYDQAPLTQWGAPGRKIIVLHYGRYSNTQELGADEEINIDNVLDIPDLLAQRIGDLIIEGD